MKPLSHFQVINNLTSEVFWPWYVTFDLINKCRFPCCIYDPTYLLGHKAKIKVKSNVNLFSQQTTTTTCDKWSLYNVCVFPAKAGDTKTTIALSCIVSSCICILIIPIAFFVILFTILNFLCTAIPPPICMIDMIKLRNLIFFLPFIFFLWSPSKLYTWHCLPKNSLEHIFPTFFFSVYTSVK